MDSLPVDAVRDTFEAALDPKTPVILSAPTGSGKSTRLPLWMAERTGEPILVVEPRRVACRSLATYLASTRGERAGESIGYSIRFEDVRGPKTEVVFVTPGVALRMLQQQELPFGAVLIDEFHERGWEIDLIAAILRQRSGEAGWSTPLVFTSATLDLERLEAALGATVVEASGRTFPVDINYQAEDTLAAPSREDLDRRVVRAVRHAIDAGDDGEILVFLPGKGEIASAERALSERAGAWNIEPMPVHGSLPPDQLRRVFAEATSTRRRVFLSTNVAETSVTLPGVTWVIDSGLVRMQMHRAGRTALVLGAIAQDSMEQRAGRAGRVRPGTCIRLWSKHWAPSTATAPEIERIALDDVLLRAGMCGLDGRTFDDAPWVTTPPEFAVERARARLRELGALDGAARLTDTGRALVDLPVSSFEARMMLGAPEHLAGTLADLVAILQRGTRMVLPLDRVRDREKVAEARGELFVGVTNEVHEALTALRHGDPRRHALRRDAWSEARKLASQLRDAIGAKPSRPQKDQRPLPDPDVLAEHIIRKLPEATFVLRDRAKKQAKKPSRRRSTGQPWGNGDVELMVDPYIPVRTEDRPDEHKRPVAGVILSHTWIGKSKGHGVVGRGSMLLPVPLGTLARCGVGEEELTSYDLDRSKRPARVVGVVRRTHAGVVLGETTEPLTGEALCRAAASLTLERRLFKGAGELVRDDLHLWGLLSQWRETLETEHWDLERFQGLEVPTPEDYLAAKFEELGLESNEELQLLEIDDLRVDLAGMTGIYAHELDELATEFPRVWEYLRAEYTCTPNPASRRVLMEPRNRAAKERGEPPKELIPRFRGFGVTYKQASRSLKLR